MKFDKIFSKILEEDIDPLALNSREFDNLLHTEIYGLISGNVSNEKRTNEYPGGKYADVNDTYEFKKQIPVNKIHLYPNVPGEHEYSLESMIPQIIADNTIDGNYILYDFEYDTDIKANWRSEEDNPIPSKITANLLIKFANPPIQDGNLIIEDIIGPEKDLIELVINSIDWDYIKAQ